MPKADISNYKGREQAYIKHYLLEQYLPEWAYKVGRAWDTLVYVDGFAGPWETTDPNYGDSSFAVGVDTLRRCRSGLKSQGVNLTTAAILVENDPDAFKKLESFAGSNTGPEVSVRAVPGKFVDNIPEINRLVRLAGPRPFKFVLLDPKGWADIPMHSLRGFLKNRSCEVLITLMTKHINRFLNKEDRAASYDNLFGRKGVLQSLQSVVGEDRIDRAVTEYGQSLQLLCGFQFVSSAAILEPDEAQVRYFLVYGTNHPRGIEVFKAAEKKAAEVQELVRQEKIVEKSGQPKLAFNGDRPISNYTCRLYQRYCERARTNVLERLRTSPKDKIPYTELFCSAMAFPLVTPDDLLAWLKELNPAIEVHPARGHKKLSPVRDDDYVAVVDRARVV